MMNRRGFLTALLGSAAAMPVLSSLDFARNTSFKFIPPSLEQPTLTDYETVHVRALELFENARERYGLTTRFITSDRLMLGSMMSVGHLAKHQFSVSCDLDRPDALEAAMMSLAQRCSEVGLDSFGRLNEDLPGTAYAKNCGELRMVVQYLLHRDMLAVRFDVIGGISPHGEIVARRYRSESTKRAIRKRLGTYPSASRFIA